MKRNRETQTAVMDRADSITRHRTCAHPDFKGRGRFAVAILILVISWIAAPAFIQTLVEQRAFAIGSAFTDKYKSNSVGSHSEPLFGGTPTPTPVCTGAPSGIISWWPGEGNAQDVVSHYDGTLQNGATFATGTVGQAFSLDGIDDATVVNNNAALNPTSITIEAWVKPDNVATGTLKSVVTKWGFDATIDSYWLGLLNQGGVIRVFGGIGDGATGDPGLFGGTVSLNNWSHIAMTYDAATDLHRLYLNGVQVNQRTRPNGIYPTTSRVFIGREDSNNNRFFSGLIDEPTIYSRALTDAEILAIYNAGSNGKCRVTPGARADFDGDGKTDLSVFRPSEGNWYLNRSTAGFAVINWGIGTDTLVPGDYDNDGKTDTAVFRPTATAGQPDFYVLNSNGFTISGFEWGVPGDIPVVGDYDGDGTTDIAVWRPSDQKWYIRNSANNTARIDLFGSPGDVPLAMDYDGDGRDNPAVFRPSNNTWYLASTVEPTTTIPFGTAGDNLVPADYDGDAKDDVAVYRPSNGTWYILRSTNGAVDFIPFGISTDVPVPGDYDGDGKNDVAVYRDGTWYAQRSTSGLLIASFGLSTDMAIPAQYIP